MLAVTAAAFFSLAVIIAPWEGAYALIQSASARPEDIIAANPDEKVRITFLANNEPFVWTVAHSTFSHGLEIFLPENLADVVFSFNYLYFDQAHSTAGDDMYDEYSFNPIQAPTIYFNITGQLKNCTFELQDSEMESGIHFYVEGSGNIENSTFRIQNVGVRTSGHIVRFAIAYNISAHFASFVDNEVRIENITDLANTPQSELMGLSSVGVSYDIADAWFEAPEYGVGNLFANNRIFHQNITTLQAGIFFIARSIALLLNNTIETVNVRIIEDDHDDDNMWQFIRAVRFNLEAQATLHNQFFTANVVGSNVIISGQQTDGDIEIRNNLFKTEAVESLEVTLYASFITNNSFVNNNIRTTKKLSLVSSPDGYYIAIYMYVEAGFNAWNSVSSRNVSSSLSECYGALHTFISFLFSNETMPLSLAAGVANGQFGTMGIVGNLAVSAENFNNFTTGVRIDVGELHNSEISFRGIQVHNYGEAVQFSIYGATNCRFVAYDIISSSAYAKAFPLDTNTVYFFDYQVLHNVTVLIYNVISSNPVKSAVLYSSTSTFCDSTLTTTSVTVTNPNKPRAAGVRFEAKGTLIGVTIRNTDIFADRGGVEIIMSQDHVSALAETRRHLIVENTNINGNQGPAVKWSSERHTVSDSVLINKNVTSRASSLNDNDEPSSAVRIEASNNLTSMTIINREIRHTGIGSPATGAMGVSISITNGGRVDGGSYIENNDISVDAWWNAIGVQFTIIDSQEGTEAIQRSTIINKNIKVFHSKPAPSVSGLPTQEGGEGDSKPTVFGNNRGVVMYAPTIAWVDQVVIVNANVSLVLLAGIDDVQNHSSPVVTQIVEDVAVEVDGVLFTAASVYYDCIHVVEPNLNHGSLLSFYGEPLPSILVKLSTSSHGSQLFSAFHVANCHGGDLRVSNFSISQYSSFEVYRTTLITNYSLTIPSVSHASSVYFYNSTLWPSTHHETTISMGLIHHNATIIFKSCQFGNLIIVGNLSANSSMIFKQVKAGKVTLGVGLTGSQAILSGVCLTGQLLLANFMRSDVSSDLPDATEGYSALRVENSLIVADSRGTQPVVISSNIEKSLLLFYNSTVDASVSSNVSNNEEAEGFGSAVLFDKNARVTSASLLSFISCRLISANPSLPALLFAEKSYPSADPTAGIIELWGNQFVNGGADLYHFDLSNENTAATHVGLIIGNELPSLTVGGKYNISCNTNQQVPYFLNISTIALCADSLSYARCQTVAARGPVFSNPHTLAAVASILAVTPCSLVNDPIAVDRNDSPTCPFPQAPEATPTITTATSSTTPPFSSMAHIVSGHWAGIISLLLLWLLALIFNF